MSGSQSASVHKLCIRPHGLTGQALHDVFRAIVESKLLYAAPAWSGFASAAARGQIAAFLRRCEKLGFRSHDSPSFNDACCEADDKLFKSISSNAEHVLHQFLPATRCPVGGSRRRRHNFVLPPKLSALDDKNFLYRLLYKASY